MTQHTPVLLQETIDALEVQEGRKYVDATFGLGGHTKEIVQRGGKVLGIELDKESIELRKNEFQDTNVELVLGNYADVEEIAKAHGYAAVHGVLFDLGLSMWQIRESGKGFSYEKPDEELDMRINSAETGPGNPSAADIVNNYSEDELYDIFTKYAEELNSRPIAQAIIKSRNVEKIRTNGELLNVIKSVNKSPSTIARIFQALRVEVNNEFENIEKGLWGALSILEDDGHVVVITFHPSEDRFVKNWIKKNNIHASKKAVKAKSGNSFERSALMRIIQK